VYGEQIANIFMLSKNSFAISRNKSQALSSLCPCKA